MRTWRSGPPALAAAAVLLAAACTPGEPPERPEGSPTPLPTDFEGEVPPGVGGEPLRHLHGPGADAPDILGDELGVRIDSLGEAFLISSNSEEWHLLMDPETGEALWQGRRRIERFSVAGDGSEVLVLTGDRGRTSVVDDTGRTVWRGTQGREEFVGGTVVRRPLRWSPGDPYGEYTVLDTEGRELWDYTFEPPPEGGDGGGEGADAEDPDAEGSGDPDSGGEDPGEDDPDRLGVPVAARDGVLLLDDGAGLLQARGLGAGDEGGGDGAGDLLWYVDGQHPDLAGAAPGQRPRPQVVGGFDLPADAEGDGGTESPEPTATGDPATGEPTGEDTDASASPAPGSGPSGSADPSASDGGSARPTVLVRWSLPEDPSVLSLHDLRTGEILWSLPEPGANPAADPYAPAPLGGALYDDSTRTLLLPQASGATPLIAVDLAAGEIRWEFEDDAERAITPAFALGGYVYGDSSAADDPTTAQVVLEAETKDVAAEGLDAYVEAATAGGYSIVVSGRQRFVFPPAGPPGAPTGTGG
ncbi:hypothetical protein LG943_22235 [Streptomonospora sp. S1-112]|uniref:PQQ enzyme repeat protein n=1 Tax=Streptomonospora mangrovi TaxID=2883123 RepID=A0A9X3SJ59_9ACTN|nr:hypothetical protein [Streptomonospora mangrovi]MDA0567014.1 hypothetical protein [Streptomonospora mangrovi]